MTVYLTANDNRSGQKVRLLTNTQSDSVEVSFDPLVIPTGAAFDYIVEAVTDLPAAVGGYHSLTTGSWAIKNALNLGTNGLRVESGQDVYLQGMGWSKVITSSANNGLLVQGTMLCKGLAINCSGTNGCQVANSVGGHYQQFDDCYFVSTNSTGLAIGGGSDEFIRVNNTRITGVTESVFISANTNVRVWLEGCRVTGATSGIRIPGNCGYLFINQSQVIGTTRGLYHTAGANSVHVCSCANSQITGGGGGGIDWVAANLPDYGLLVVGCHLDGVAAYVGHSPASPRANYKANCRAGTTLLTETAIVP